MSLFAWIRSTGQTWKLGVAGSGLACGALVMLELVTGGGLFDRAPSAIVPMSPPPESVAVRLRRPLIFRIWILV